MTYDNSKHQGLINALVAKGASSHNFKRNACQAVAGKHTHGPDDYEDIGGEQVLCCDRCMLEEDLGGFRLIPDAHRIDTKNLHIFAYEVEVTHRLPADKLELYAEWYGQFDEFEWQLRLIIVDRFGNEHEIDLFPIAYRDATQGIGDVEAARRYLGCRKPGETPCGAMP